MSTTILDRPQASDLIAPAAVCERQRGPIVVATDASQSSDAAVRAARAIAAQSGEELLVVAVFKPIPLPDVQLANTPQLEEQGRAELRRQVREQLDRMAPGLNWPVQVVTGNPAASIATLAKNLGASMVIMGLGGHGMFERVFGDELVLKVLRLGTVPVLAVAGGYSGPPRRVLAAVDFSSSCVRALTLGRDFVRPGARLTLAHVLSPDLDPVNWTGTNAGYHGTVGRAMDRVIAEMGFGDARVERKLLSGDPAKELLRLSGELRPDLIVTGSHGHNFLTRLLLGSVSSKLIRQANCSVLVAPPIEGQEFMDELPQATTQFSHYEWAERLEEFTRRNAGRRGTLEEIHPEIGAHVQEKHAVFAGASFDPRDGRVNIMFGPVGAVDQHFSRSIAGITAVQMLRDKTGKDLLLRVAHGRGQTLLTLER